MIELLALVEDDAIMLDEAALELAALDRDEVDLTPYVTRIAFMGAQLLSRAAGITGAHDRAALLRDLVAGEHGMTGDESCFDNEAGADLIATLDRRCGLPVTLSLIYVALARKVGWHATALNVPGHVLIRMGEDPGAVVQDPFDEGAILDRQGVERVLARVLGAQAVPDPAYLTPLSNRATLVRLLTNQAARARRLGDLERALVLHERMTAFAPTFSALWWERARLEQHLGRLSAARASLLAMRETTRERSLLGRIDAALKALARSTN